MHEAGHTVALTGRFVLLVAVGAVPVVLSGYVPHLAGWVLLSWLLFCILLAALDIALAGSPRRLEFQRELPIRVRLGEEALTSIVVRNAGRRRVHGALRDAWQPSAGAPRERVRVDVPAGERRRYELSLRPWRRGERRSEFVVVRSFGPLGVAGRQATVHSPAAIRVLPPFNSRKHLPSRLARLRELDGQTSVMIRGQGTEFDSLREYVRGDDVRSIDWRGTARRTDLVVRTWRPERDRRVVIVADSGRHSAARVADEPRLDTAFEATLLLSALASRAGDRVDFLAYDQRSRGRVRGATGAALMSELVDTMAGIEPQLIETGWHAIPAEVQGITTQRALVVIITPIDSPGASTELLAVLPQLTQKHLVLVASVTDPVLAEVATDHTGRDEIYRAAAAERSLIDQARVAAAIRSMGADVVTGSPAQLPPALADRYLALKAAGRL